MAATDIDRMSACMALGLSFWAVHPERGCVWAVDADKGFHRVRINMAQGLACLLDERGEAVGNPASFNPESRLQDAVGASAEQSLIEI